MVTKSPPSGMVSMGNEEINSNNYYNMKTKKELNELSNAIGKAVRAYHQAIFENIKESGKEFKVIGDNDEDEDDVEGLNLTIIGRHDEAVDIVVDKVRYHQGNAIECVEVHIVRDEYRDVDYWCNADVLGDDLDYVYDSIDWEK